MARTVTVAFAAVLVTCLVGGPLLAREDSADQRLRGRFIERVEKAVGDQEYLGIIVQIEGRDERAVLLIGKRQEDLLHMARGLREGQIVEVEYRMEDGQKWVLGMRRIERPDVRREEGKEPTPFERELLERIARLENELRGLRDENRRLRERPGEEPRRREEGEGERREVKREGDREGERREPERRDVGEVKREGERREGERREPERRETGEVKREGERREAERREPERRETGEVKREGERREGERREPERRETGEVKREGERREAERREPERRETGEVKREGERREGERREPERRETGEVKREGERREAERREPERREPERREPERRVGEQQVRGKFVRLVEKRVGEQEYLGVVIRVEGREEPVTLLIPNRRGEGGRWVRDEALAGRARQLREGQMVEVGCREVEGQRWVTRIAW